MRILILTLLLSSCSYFDRDNKAKEVTPSEALTAKKEFYCNEDCLMRLLDTSTVGE